MKFKKFKAKNKAKQAPIVKPKNNKPKLMVSTSDDVRGYLKNSKFNFEALKRYALEMGADRLIYVADKKAFEAFKGKQSIDLLSIGMF